MKSVVRIGARPQTKALPRADAPGLRQTVLIVLGTGPAEVFALANPPQARVFQVLLTDPVAMLGPPFVALLRRPHFLRPPAGEAGGPARSAILP